MIVGRICEAIESLSRWLCIENPIEDKRVGDILRASSKKERLKLYIKRLESGGRECTGCFLYRDEEVTYYCATGIALDQMVKSGIGMWQTAPNSGKEYISIGGELICNKRMYQFVYGDGSLVDVVPLLRDYLGIDLYNIRPTKRAWKVIEEANLGIDRKYLKYGAISIPLLSDRGMNHKRVALFLRTQCELLEVEVSNQMSTLST
jgi:hypothetical protein